MNYTMTTYLSYVHIFLLYESFHTYCCNIFCYTHYMLIDLSLYKLFSSIILSLLRIWNNIFSSSKYKPFLLGTRIYSS